DRGDLVPVKLRIEVSVDEANGASQRIPREFRGAVPRFVLSFFRRLSEAGRDRLCQFFGAILTPLISRDALDEIAAHYVQRVFDFAPRHLSPCDGFVAFFVLTTHCFSSFPVLPPARQDCPNMTNPVLGKLGM